MTPMMQQYFEVKERYPDAILFFRMGDFYEMFFEDAVVGARALDLTLTSRNKGAEDEVPMAGVPHHAAQSYIAQLIEQGFSVAVCEQIEDPQASNGLVKRDVVRVVTPGVVIDTENLEAKESNYVAAVSLSRSGVGEGFGVAYLDVSTGDFRATLVDSLEELTSELNRVEARELLWPQEAEALAERVGESLGGRVFVRLRPASHFDAGVLLEQVGQGVRLAAEMEVDGYFLGASAIEAFFSSVYQFGFTAPALVEDAAAAVCKYIVDTQRGVPAHVQRVDCYRAQSFLVIDEATKANLELTRTLMGGRRQGSLLSVIDETVTAMGGRRLRQWLGYPLVDRQRIEDRLGAVEILLKKPALRQDVRALLDEVYDVERLCGRVSAGTANAKDLRALLVTLQTVPGLRRALDGVDSPYLASLRDELDDRKSLCDEIDRALVENPPTALTEGGIFKAGWDEELDEILEIATHGKDWLLRYESQEKEETGISSLKVKYNKVFGYYIEVTKANLQYVPTDRYIRKQTLANSERYYTPELKEMEEKILGAEERRCKLEYQLFEALRGGVNEQAAVLLRTASRLADLDVVAGLAELAARRDYQRPELREDGRVEIEEGRHPVVEAMLKDERFVPNSVVLDPQERRLILITGPNMAGKSTVIRQVALMSLLAQIGSFVPAKRASLSVVDKIFSRVGASDNLAKGQSTFMVEMTETAHILRNATEASLVILDEIGRGTATFDGLSIAWAVAEHLHDQIRAKTLFATHYHELCERVVQMEAAANMSIAVKEWKDNIVFLRKLVDGPANRSYGVQVGRLAGLPAPVVARAREVLGYLESGQFDKMLSAQASPTAGPEAGDDAAAVAAAQVNGAGALSRDQLTLFTVAQGAAAALDEGEAEVLQRLRESNLNAMTPLQALNLISELKERLTQ